MPKSRPQGIFSAIVEPFGHRDLAANHPVEFVETNRLFRDALGTAMGRTEFPTKNYISVLDKSFLQHEDVVVLLRTLAALRRDLLLASSGPQLLRALVIFGADVCVIRQGSNGEFVDLNSRGWELSGRINEFKGLGIWVDPFIFESTTGDTAKWIKKWTVKNFYIPNLNAPRPHFFHDLRMGTPWSNPDGTVFKPEDEIFTYTVTRNMVRLFRETFMRSPSASRYFASLLSNWIESMVLSASRSEGGDDDRFSGVGLDYFFCRARLDSLRNVVGGDYVALALMKKVYRERVARKEEAMLKAELKSSENHVNAEERKTEIRKRIAELEKREPWDTKRLEMLVNFLLCRCQWISKKLRNDDKNIRYSEDFLPRGIKRQYFIDLANASPGRFKIPPAIDDNASGGSGDSDYESD